MRARQLLRGRGPTARGPAAQPLPGRWGRAQLTIPEAHAAEMAGGRAAKIRRSPEEFAAFLRSHRVRRRWRRCTAAPESCYGPDGQPGPRRKCWRRRGRCSDAQKIGFACEAQPFMGQLEVKPAPWRGFKARAGSQAGHQTARQARAPGAGRARAAPADPPAASPASQPRSPAFRWRTSTSAAVEAARESVIRRRWRAPGWGGISHYRPLGRAGRL